MHFNTPHRRRRSPSSLRADQLIEDFEMLADTADIMLLGHFLGGLGNVI
jgi:hypothetical protein